MPVKLQTPRKADQMIFLDSLWSEVFLSLPTSKSSEFRKHPTKTHIKFQKKEKQPKQNPGFLTHLHLLVHFLQSLVIFDVQLPSPSKRHLQPPHPHPNRATPPLVQSRCLPTRRLAPQMFVLSGPCFGISCWGVFQQESWEAHCSQGIFQWLHDVTMHDVYNSYTFGCIPLHPRQ